MQELCAALALVVVALCLYLMLSLDGRASDCVNGNPMIYNKTVYHCVKG